MTATTPTATYRTTYATGADFCAIFQADKNALYSLALLLTADHGKAEAVFVSALEDCLSASGVFQDWARSWTGRAIVKNAIRLIVPAVGVRDRVGDEIAGSVHPSARAILELAPFERFVFVMSALEGYSERECAVLLNTSGREIAWARERALRGLAGSEEESSLVIAGSRLAPAAGAA